MSLLNHDIRSGRSEAKSLHGLMKRFLDMMRLRHSTSSRHLYMVAHSDYHALGTGLIIACVSALCTLSLMGVSLLEQATARWQHQVAAEVSIQVKSTQGLDLDTEVRKTIGVVAALPGVVRVKPLDDNDMAGLLAPWLDDGLELEEIILSKMIVVSVDQADPPDFDVMRDQLSKSVKGAVLDTHQPWQSHLGEITGRLLFLGYSLAGLIGLSAFITLVVTLIHHVHGKRKLIDVLLSSGAEDGFIANLYQAYFILLALRASLVGFVVAGLILWLGIYIFDAGDTIAGLIHGQSLFGILFWPFIQIALLTSFTVIVISGLVARLSVNNTLSR